MRCGHGIYGEVEVGGHAVDAIATAEHISLGCSLARISSWELPSCLRGLLLGYYDLQSRKFSAKCAIYSCETNIGSSTTAPGLSSASCEDHESQARSKSRGDNATRSSAQSKLSVCVIANDSIEYPRRVMMKEDPVLKTQLAPVRL